MATGDAPIMKQKNYKVDQEKKVEWIIAFIRKYLKLEDPESLVNYKPVSITTFYQCYWPSVISFGSAKYRVFSHKDKIWIFNRVF